MRKLNLNKGILIYILIYFLIAGLYCGINGTLPTGEWDDYTYPAVTLLTGHKISATESDLPLIKEYFPEWSSAIDSAGINSLSGQHTRNGGMLPWYFPTYALVCIPMIIFLRFLGLPAVYAFCYTNLFSIIAVLLVVYKCLKANEATKLLLIVLLSLNPIMFYFCWASGETLIYAFLAIGLVCWYNKWYKRAAVFISLAGTLNTTIMSIGIIMIVEYFIELIRSRDKDINLLQFVKRNFLSIIGYGSCYIIGLIPMVYFYYNTGYINLTAANPGFLTGTGETIFQRFAAYLFDFNFGLLPYYPAILMLGFVLLAVSVVKKCWRYMEWFAAFAINVLLYSVMVHINSGMSGIARYNAWGALILIFAVCLFSMELVKKSAVKEIIRAGIWVNAVILLLIVYNYGPTGASKTSYVYWTPIAEWVIDNYPSLYNPLHSTFASRTLHRDGGYNPETPVIYSAEDGYVRKILASESDGDYLKKTLMSEVNEEWLYKEIDTLKSDETYISIPLKHRVAFYELYTLGEEMLFTSEKYNVQNYIVSGLSTMEDWGTWTSGEKFYMKFKIESEAASLHGYIDCGTINDEQAYRLYVNNELVAEGTVIEEKIEFDFETPLDGYVDLYIELPNAVSPRTMGLSTDDRVLSLYLRNIIFTENFNSI